MHEEFTVNFAAFDTDGDGAIDEAEFMVRATPPTSPQKGGGSGAELN